MAKEPRQRQPPDAIKRQIAESRDQIAREFRGLRYEMDIPRRIRRSLREQTGLWIGAAVVIGAMVVLLPARKREVHVDLAGAKKGKAPTKLLETGFLLGLARVALTVLKPTVTRFVMNKMRGSFGSRERSFKW